MAAIGTPDLGGGKPPPLVPPDLSGIGNALGNAWMAATDPLQRQRALQRAAAITAPQLSGPLRLGAMFNPSLSQMLQPGAAYREGLTQEEFPQVPPIYGAPAEVAGAAFAPAAEGIGRAIRPVAEDIGHAVGPAVQRFATEAAGEGEVGLGVPQMARYIVNRGKTISTVIDTTTGKPLPLAFEDADKAERLAAARNAAAAGNAVHAIPEAQSAYDRILGRSTATAASPAAAGVTDLQRMVASGRDFTRVPAAEAAASEAANPSVVRRGLSMPQEAAAQQAEARAASDLARRTAKPGSFGSAGTAFAGVSPRALTRTIQAATPYRSIKEFGAAVRSGEAAKNGAPQGLIEQFLKGEVEQGLRGRGVAQSEIDRLMGRAAPVLRPASPAGVSGPLTESERAEAVHAAQAGEFPSSTPTEANSARAKQISDSLEKVGIHHTPEEVYDDLTGGAAAGVVAPPVPPSRPGVLRTVENVSGLGKSLSTALSPFHFL
ncbi:MAG: hypothetical protein KGJ45_12045, partial [Elusimicrobia bacterium]|nr:hypothetical protein [Elusimicrobiota bacterium]